MNKFYLLKQLILVIFFSHAFSSYANNPTYCVPSASTVTFPGREYISNVSVGNINNKLKDSSDVYQDYSSVDNIIATPGSTLTINLTLGGSTVRSLPAQAIIAGYFIVYIDLKNDGTFTDAGDTLFAGTVIALTSPRILSATFTIPATATGTTRMRIKLTSNIDTNPCSINSNSVFAAGAMEDYNIVFGPEGGPLPVNFTSFTGTLNSQQNVDLSWTTALQKNNSLFIIEASLDGIYFYALDSMVVTYNSSTTQHYHYVQTKPQAAVWHYRIKQVDGNGVSSYTDIISVTVGGKNGNAFLYPIPASNKVTVHFNMITNGDEQIEIFSADMKSVKKVSVGSRLMEQQINISNLTNGIYFIKIYGTTNNSVLQFVKSK